MRALLLAAALLVSPSAAADENLQPAREAYLEGTALIKRAQWSDALAAFERSARLYPHSSTTFSIGSCQRALGRYALAKLTLERALEESAAHGNQLPQTLIDDAQSFIGEIDRTLVHLQVQIAPLETEITVDGRPLAPDRSGSLIAGVLPQGKGTLPPAPAFELVLDPGAHVFLLSTKGYTNAVVHRSFAPGERARLDLALERLPATLHVTATEPSAIVRIDDSDVGPAPVDIRRAAGEYRISVKKKGFAGYTARVRVQPGEEINLQAPLSVEKVPLYKRWWFWTTVVAVVATGATLTWALTRPPAPYDSGNTNWLVTPSN